MLQDMLDYLRNIRSISARMAASPLKECVRRLMIRYRRKPTDLQEIHRKFMQDISAVRRRQRTSRVHGLGTWRWNCRARDVCQKMLAAGLNANVGGRDQESARCRTARLTRWVQDLFNFPKTSTGLFVTGTSMANLIGVLVARTAKVGQGVRQDGLSGISTHSVCIDISS